MNDHPTEHDDTLPAELVDALRGLDGPAALPSAEHDAALLAGAREHLAGMPELPGVGIAQVERRGRSRHVLAFIGAGGAVAAAAAVTFAVVLTQGDPKHNANPAIAQHDMDSRPPADTGHAEPASPQALAPLAADLDGSGAVDILDAFALARSIERDDAGLAAATHDFNGDGQVDTQDADWLAQRAVAVRQDGGQG